MVHSQCLTALPAGRWALEVFSQQALGSFMQMPTSKTSAFEGLYSPTFDAKLCRYRMTLLERAQLVLHFETNIPAGFVVSIWGPEEAEATAAAAMVVPGVIVGGEPCKSGDVDPVSSCNTPLYRWHAETLFTAPAVNVEGLTKEQAYIVDVRLQNDTCPFEVQPNGDIPEDLHWRLVVYSDKEADWAKDSTRDVFFQTTLSSWNGDDKNRTERARAVLQRREDESAAHDNNKHVDYGDFRSHVTKTLPDDDASEAISLKLGVRHIPKAEGVNLRVLVSGDCDSRKNGIERHVESFRVKQESQLSVREQHHDYRRDLGEKNNACFSTWRNGGNEKLMATMEKRKTLFATVG